MTSYIIEIKRQLRDVYGFKPINIVGSELVFGMGEVPDGDYPMVINDKLDHIRLVDGKIHCCNSTKTVRKTNHGHRPGY